MFNSKVGNLTFTVNGFSGYNITDNTTPIITINSPGNKTRSMYFNVTLNGTETQISTAYFILIILLLQIILQFIILQIV